jgi:chaperonin GroES
MNVRPLRDRVLAQRVEEQEQRLGGIIVPDTAKEKPQQARVVAVGGGLRLFRCRFSLPAVAAFVSG